MLYIYDSFFNNTYSLSRGAVIFADYKESYVYAVNSSFINNFAQYGGVFFAHYESYLEFDTCVFKSNKASSGGVARVEN